MNRPVEMESVPFVDYFKAYDVRKDRIQQEPVRCPLYACFSLNFKMGYKLYIIAFVCLLL